MPITIKFNDNVKHQYDSFNEITQLDNYDEIIYIHCYCNKNLTYLPKLPNSLTHLYCWYNKLTCLPKLPNSLIYLNYNNNPIYDHIKKYFDGDRKQYRNFQHNVLRVFVNKIGSWYLECKYNPKYLACRKILKLEHKELFDIC